MDPLRPSRAEIPHPASFLADAADRDGPWIRSARVRFDARFGAAVLTQASLRTGPSRFSDFRPPTRDGLWAEAAAHLVPRLQAWAEGLSAVTGAEINTFRIELRRSAAHAAPIPILADCSALRDAVRADPPFPPGEGERTANILFGRFLSPGMPVQLPDLADHDAPDGDVARRSPSLHAAAAAWIGAHARLFEPFRELGLLLRVPPPTAHERAAALRASRSAPNLRRPNA